MKLSALVINLNNTTVCVSRIAVSLLSVRAQPLAQSIRNYKHVLMFSYNKTPNVHLHFHLMPSRRRPVSVDRDFTVQMGTVNSHEDEVLQGYSAIG